MKISEIRRQYQESQATVTSLKEAKEKAYLEYQRLETAFHRADKNSPLYSIISLGNGISAKVDARVFDTNPVSSPIQDFYILTYLSDSDGDLGVWEAVIKLTPHQIVQIKAIDELLEQWKTDQITWPWPTVDEHTFYNS
jgi:hypothetical protein